MGRKAILIGAAAAAALSFVTVGAASAAVSVLGNGAANLCSSAALSGDAKDDDIANCNAALNDPLTDIQRAGTYVNRGVLMLRRKNFVASRADFDMALQIVPTMGEAVVNRGASLVAERRFAEGLAEIDRGLTMNPEEPEKAYYNRALANEGLDDMKAAYFDYLKALELKPGWDRPQTELARFTVVRQ
jgi:tetratricopeptide (TPR) repeat protein